MTQIRDLATHREPHVSVMELAAYWHVCEKTVYRLVTKGALPAVRVGRSLRIRTVDARAIGRIDETC